MTLYTPINLAEKSMLALDGWFWNQVKFFLPVFSKILTVDASLSGWVGVIGTLSEESYRLINILEH